MIYWTANIELFIMSRHWYHDKRSEMDCSQLLRMLLPKDTFSFAIIQSAALIGLYDRTQWSRKTVGVKDERLSQMLSSQYTG